MNDTNGSQRVFDRMVVGVDGSESSLKAVEWVARVAGACHAEVVAVSTYNWNPMVGHLTNQQVLEELRRQLEGPWTEPLREAAVRYQVVLEEGDPRVVLLMQAYRRDADLVVVGSRGRSQLTEVLLGSVAHYLTHHSRIPVVVVRDHGDTLEELEAGVAERAAEDAAR